MRQNVFKIILICFIGLLSTYCIYRYAMHSKVYVDKKIENIDLNNISKLMIVAHPDDDYIWGGSHLIDDDYLVVCVTCGSKRNRVLEFKRAMNKTDDAYLMLGYPDKTNGERDNWSTVYEDIYQDLKHIIEYKNWELIVTHNPDGEYSHIHHKMTSSMVTDIVKTDNLYYFGKYYKKGEIPDTLTSISSENAKKKREELIPIYASQKSTMKKLEHMFNYENWVKSNEWGK